MKKQKECTHGVKFNKKKCEKLSVLEVKALYPRGFFTEEKPCPKCGFVGIAYASFSHYLYGDW